MNFRILINYVRDDIAEELFRNNVKMVENKIQFFYIEFNCTWVEIHLHESSIKIRIMLSNDDGWLDCFKRYAHGVFNMLNPNLQPRTNTMIIDDRCKTIFYGLFLKPHQTSK